MPSLCNYISTAEVVIPNMKDSDYVHVRSSPGDKTITPCDTGYITTGHLILVSLLRWLLSKTQKMKKAHGSQVMQLSPSMTSTMSGTSDYLIYSRYLAHLKHAFSLTTATIFFAFRKCKAMVNIILPASAANTQTEKEQKRSSMLTAKICKG